MTDRELVARIARSAGGKAGYKQLVLELGLGGGRERRLLLEQLARLTVRGALTKLDRDHWGIPRKAASFGGGRDNLVAGRLDLHRDGYGFVRPNARQASGVTDDIFVPPNEINGAMQGDQVLVEVEPPRADGRLSGRIARVLERRNPTVVGTFHYSRGERYPLNVVIPFDERITQPIVIPEGAEVVEEKTEATPHRVLGREAKAYPKVDSPEGLEGLVVDVEITSWPTPFKPPVGRVIEILGDPDDFGVDVEMMIRKHQLPRVFPENVLQEARAVAQLEPEEVQRRTDFRGLPIVTIDGETARDFDDAVLVQDRAGGGYELQVHIADVAEYVREGTDLDLEARLRGTSVYFPDRAIPMLPQELSTDICSLRPGEDRLVLSCVMQLSEDGRIESYAIGEGVIRSAARMTYTKVHAILEGDDVVRAQYADRVEDFERMKRLAVLMNKRREERGSIDFDLPEPVIEFDEQGQMRGVTRTERTWANRLIEEFMLAANECVATWLEDLGVPSLYRIHEKPEARRVVQFEELAASFGYSLGLGALPVKRIQTRGDRRDAQRSGRQARVHEVAEDIPVTPKMYQKLAAKIEGKPEERILSYLMLRSLRQARYSEKNEGHFALAAPTYTHFTSPIRRYPDLIVHRIAKALLRRGVKGRGSVAEGRHSSPWRHVNEGSAGASGFVTGQHRGTRILRSVEAGRSAQDDKAHLLDPPIAEAELAQIAEETSQTERRAAEAERELVEWKKVRFMEDRVGEEFSALVLNPAKFGLFVELTDLFVEGLVPIDSLRDDRYTWRENTHEIVGERWGRRFRAGDQVQVVLDRILAQERRLQFSIVEEGIPLTGKKPARPAPQAKKARKEIGHGSGVRKGKKGRGKRRR
ncbi:MAG TPA: VacB/RNase II family 3'-5' exoribonuclease [Terracidiphilus sp.]|jgi:ribonuclease R|nr:VacB/RNase II family 3'-5' exoribonuclease [Terracidiphilus sp.]